MSITLVCVDIATTWYLEPRRLKSAKATYTDGVHTFSVDNLTFRSAPRIGDTVAITIHGSFDHQPPPPPAPPNQGRTVRSAMRERNR